MGNLGGQEILVILLVGLIVLGPAKLPAAIRQAGRFAAETRRVAAGFKREFQDALGDPLTESKAMLKAADPRSLTAETASPAPPTEAGKPAAEAAAPAPPTETEKPPAETVAPAPPTGTEAAAPAASAETKKLTAASESSPDDGPT